MQSVLAELGGEMGRLKKALRTLELRWQETRESWNDPVAQRYEEEKLAELQRATRQALEGMNVALQTFRRAVEECS